MKYPIPCRIIILEGDAPLDDMTDDIKPQEEKEVEGFIVDRHLLNIYGANEIWYEVVTSDGRTDLVSNENVRYDYGNLSERFKKLMK